VGSEYGEVFVCVQSTVCYHHFMGVYPVLFLASPGLLTHDLLRIWVFCNITLMG